MLFLWTVNVGTANTSFGNFCPQCKQKLKSADWNSQDGQTAKSPFTWIIS